MSDDIPCVCRCKVNGIEVDGESEVERNGKVLWFCLDCYNDFIVRDKVPAKEDIKYCEGIDFSDEDSEETQ